MHAPEPYLETDVGIAHDLIEQIRLGTIVTAAPTLLASHVPFMIDRTRGARGMLIGHVDRANPQWRAMADGTELLVTFLGPDAYVSPSWYGTGPRVPTWLYATVHVAGRPRLVEDTAGLEKMVVDLCTTMEPDESPWRPAQVGAYIDRLLGGIVGFEIDIARIETQLRLAQQNSADDRAAVRAALGQGSLQDRRVAELMARLPPD
jgi:transcriptional regulator